MCSDLPDPKVSVRGQAASCDDLKTLCKHDGPVGERIQTSCPFSCGLCPADTGENQWSKCFPGQCSSGRPWQTQDADGIFHINYAPQLGFYRFSNCTFKEKTTAMQVQLGRQQRIDTTPSTVPSSVLTYIYILLSWFKKMCLTCHGR